MDRRQRDLELQLLCNEYASFFPRCELVLTDVDPVSTSDDIYAQLLLARSFPSHLIVESQEGSTLKVTVGVSGWYVCNEPKTLYETFEALFQRVSPAFRDEFAGRLSARLNQLQS